MTAYRYIAIPTSGERTRRSGEITGSTPGEVRAMLRRVGLQVIRLDPVRTNGTLDLLPDAVKQWINRHLRRRRRQQRAELYDGLATMLEAGTSMLEAIDTLRTSRTGSTAMLAPLRERLRDGEALADAMAVHAGWFGATDVAMVRSAEYAGTLPEVLRRLSEREQRAGEITNRLIGALTYPIVVALVGGAVTVFLSVRTLPELTRVLSVSGVETPALTRQVMNVGQLVWGGWWALLLAVPILAGMWILVERACRESRAMRWIGRLRPRVLRRAAVARAALDLAELCRCGIPIVDAMRLLAPTVRSRPLRASLLAAADEAERGAELSAALGDELWFDAEFRRLLDIGQATGSLDDLLERIGERYTRQAARLVDRLTALLEPAVILTLAVLVGVIVMAALLPLLRIREIL